MKHPIKVGLSFGLTSGIITTLGLIVGLNSATSSKLVVIGGILTIAIADALSDALGIHISEEYGDNHPKKIIWQATISTFIFKFIFALTFIIPILLFNLQTAVYISIIWALLLLSMFSFKIAKEKGKKPGKIIFEHLIIAVVVIIITNYLGIFIKSVFS